MSSKCHAIISDCDHLQFEQKEKALIEAASEGHEECVQYLIEAGADVNIYPAEGSDYKTTPLIEAALNGHSKCLDYLIQAGADVNERNIEGNTALKFTAQKGHVDCLKQLIEAGANVDDIYEVFQGSMSMGEAIRVLTQTLQCNPDPTDTALIIATKTGNTGCIEALLQAGADVNNTNNSGCTALCSATSFPNNSDCVRLLLDAGADVNHQEEHCGTIIGSVVQKGYANYLELMVKFIDWSSLETFGSSPLQTAAAWGQIECLKMLIDANADVNHQNTHGKTVLDTAVINNNITCAEILVNSGATVNGVQSLKRVASEGRAEGLEFILERGEVDVNITDDTGNNALMAAVATNCEQCVEFLLTKGADVNNAANDGSTALILSFQYQYYHPLLDLFGEDDNMYDIDDSTPSFGSGYCSPLRVVRLLLKAGAEVNRRNDRGLNALDTYTSTSFPKDKKLAFYRRRSGQ